MNYTKIIEGIIEGHISQQSLFERPENLLSQMGYKKEEILEFLDMLRKVEEKLPTILAEKEIPDERTILYCSVGF